MHSKVRHTLGKEKGSELKADRPIKTQELTEKIQNCTEKQIQKGLLAAAAAARFAWTAAAAAAIAWFWSEVAVAMSALSGALKRPAPLTAIRPPRPPGIETICAPGCAPIPGDAVVGQPARNRMPWDWAARTELGSFCAAPFATCRPCVHSTHFLDVSVLNWTTNASTLVLHSE